MRVSLVATLVLAWALLVAVCAPLEAGGVLIRAEDITAAEASELIARIDAARLADSAPFDRLAELRDQLTDRANRTRGRYPPLVRILQAMGPAAQLPMLEQIAVAAQPQGELPDRVWMAWQVALVEAIGRLRDHTSEPVLWAVLHSCQAKLMVLEAAAAGLAKLGSDSVAQRLISLSFSADSSMSRAVLAGMGHCRRVEVARHLAAVLGTRPDHGIALLVAESLGNVGSAWAWRTPAVARYGEEEATTRLVAAGALLEAYLAYDGEVRARAAKAILVVADPHTPNLISRASADASTTDRALLASLADRFSRSPIR